jgi:microcystin-dependent protein
MTQHMHVLSGSSANANNFSPANNPVWAKANQVLYAPPSSLVAMNPASVTNTGGSQPHENKQPFLVLNFIIALQGIFPSRN